ncbi:hypothetical protein [Microbacterium sp. ABRD28]|uniref:hypothetical protein n=1 Tax=Microbacterium sp. ABRD28 TaxID=2268461 RepID=UPI0013DE2B0E|nr:hypothetical protein [Microbacterium sp. ABRD28]
MATYLQLRDAAEEAHRQAAAIARGNPESEQVRILAIATAETARVVAELARKVRDLDD